MSENVSIPVTSTIISGAKMADAMLVVAVKGNVDVKNSPDLRAGLLALIKDHPAQKLVLDLSGVSYMDSSAIAVLVESLKEMKKQQGRVFLCCVQPRVMGLLEIARLDKIFVVVKDEAEAKTK